MSTYDSAIYLILAFSLFILAAFLLAAVGNWVSDFHRKGMERVRRYEEREGSR